MLIRAQAQVSDRLIRRHGTCTLAEDKESTQPKKVPYLLVPVDLKRTTNCSLVRAAYISRVYAWSTRLLTQKRRRQYRLNLLAPGAQRLPPLKNSGHCNRRHAAASNSAVSADDRVSVSGTHSILRAPQNKQSSWSTQVWWLNVYGKGDLFLWVLPLSPTQGAANAVVNDATPRDRHTKPALTANSPRPSSAAVEENCCGNT